MTIKELISFLQTLPTEIPIKCTRYDGQCWFNEDNQMLLVHVIDGKPVAVYIDDLEASHPMDGERLTIAEYLKIKNP